VPSPGARIQRLLTTAKLDRPWEDIMDVGPMTGPNAGAKGRRLRETVGASLMGLSEVHGCGLSVDEGTGRRQRPAYMPTHRAPPMPV